MVALGLAAVTMGSGVLNLLAVMGGPRNHRLAELFPIEFFRLSRTLTLLIGFALIVSSLNIYRRKRRAWRIVLALASLSTLFHAIREHSLSETLFSAALVLLLLVTRPLFTVKSSVPDLGSGLVRLATAAAIAIGYGVAGFWFLDAHHFGINFHIGDAIVTTMRLLSLAGDPRLVPRTHYAQWFLDSLYLTTVTAALYSGFALFRPVIYQFSTLPRERALARTIVEQYARTSLDYFKLWSDKSYFFSPSHRAVIAYHVAGNVALALGDPVGPPEEIAPALRAFLAMCDENGWIAGFHQVLPDFLPYYRRAGLRKLKIGDDATVDLTTFSLEGKARREFRYKIRQLEAMGIRTLEYPAPVPDEVVAQLERVSDEWLQIPGRRERTFTLGMFTAEYVRSTPVLAAVDSAGDILGFVNMIAIGDSKELSVDLMRRRSNAPNGIMEYLFAKLFLRAKEQGFHRFNLGLAPMAGFQEREEATAEERAIHIFFQQMNFLFSFRGLRQFKAKFATTWEPRYLVYRRALDLPRLALGLRRVSEVKDAEGEEQAA